MDELKTLFFMPMAYDPLQVALDAATIDIVFSDSDGMQGGFVDDNFGLDYHISVANDGGHFEKLKV